MTFDDMARLHAAAFPAGRGWSAREIAGLAQGPGGFLVTRANGFALGRALAGEAELLTLAVAPQARRSGEGRALLAAFETQARARMATAAFLEVAADNTAARALYAAAGWTETGRRRGYYATASGAVDALTLAKPLDAPAPHAAP